MNSFSMYILESTVCISVLYLLFRLLMRKESSFAISRMTLLTIVAASLVIPVIHLPQQMQSPVHVRLNPEFQENKIIQNQSVQEKTEPITFELQNEISPGVKKQTIPLEKLLIYFYIAGMVIAFGFLIRNIILILLLFHKAAVIQKSGYRLLIINGEIPSFAFGRSVVMSRTDFDSHGSAIIAHEQAHIKLYHFYDLILVELVKIFHWFNPSVYRLISDLKEIHEYQADDNTLQSGVDATKYQLLIIQKSVGERRFALANSFNHCQIKNRIVMMNKLKTSKAWRWKVATFLPLLALLLMAFGKKGGDMPIKEGVSLKVESPSAIIQEGQSKSLGRVIEVKKDGDYIDNKQYSLEDVVQKGKEWAKSSNDWIRLQIDESVSNSRVDEILQRLSPGMYHIIQTTPNSDDLIYFAGDVSQLAKFSQGKWDNWLKTQLDQFSGGKSSQLIEYHLTFSFIIDKNGKVKNGHIVKPSEYPEINSAMEKILNQIPDWVPARRLGEVVSVYEIHEILRTGQKLYTTPKK